jgi:hypothetical protein
MQNQYSALSSEHQGNRESKRWHAATENRKWLSLLDDALLWICIAFFIGFAAVLLSGCTNVRGRGGVTSAQLGGDMQVKLQQPENPKQSSEQKASDHHLDTFSYPPGTIISNVEPVLIPSSNGKAFARGHQMENGKPAVIGTKTNVIVIGGTVPAVHTVEDKKSVQTHIGAAYEDTVGKILAIGKSIRWIQIVGIVLVILGIATIAYPPIRAVVNSTTTSMLIIGFGLALVFVTPFISLHPGICLGVALGVVGLYWFAHHHGTLRAEATHLKEMLSPTTTGTSGSQSDK